MSTHLKINPHMGSNAAIASRMPLPYFGHGYVMDYPCTIYTVRMHSSCTVNALSMHYLPLGTPILIILYMVLFC